MLLSILSSFSDAVRRLRNRPFLDAAMATAALVSTADEEVRLAEQLALDRLLERIDLLKPFPVHTAVDRHRFYVERIAADRAAGSREALAVVAGLRGRDEAAELLLHVATSIAGADGSLSPPEQARMDEIRDALGVGD